MAIQLFGYSFGKVEDPKKEAEQIPSFAPPPNEDGAYEVAPGGSYGTFVDLEGTAKTEAELVTKYRDLALQAEVESAIEDIIDEAIVREDNKSVIEINLDNVEFPNKVKDRIREEFKNVLNLLDFNNMAYEVFRRWYIDGRLYYHMMIDEKSPRDGIKEIRYVDPRRIRKVREPLRRSSVSASAGNVPFGIAPAYNEFYLYIHTGVTGSTYNQGIKISKDSIAYVHSGLLDQRNRMVLSHLHKAIKPMNQLRMLEDAVVIYRLSRAPERRIFYIDVGNLPKMKAEQYIRDMMVKHKNRLVYDASTGEVRDDRKFMTMLEDFWLPRREGGRGTEITTLPGGQNLGEMEDVEYFRRKLYKSLHVPQSRLQSETTFNMGRGAEITRDEVKFSKYIDRLRLRFSHLFDALLETQLILRGVMTREEWKKIKECVHYDYLRDNYYAELKDQEIITSRLNLLQTADQYVGKYFSAKYIKEKVLKFTEEEIEKMQEEVEDEESQISKLDKTIPTPEDETSNMQPIPSPSGNPKARGPIRTTSDYYAKEELEPKKELSEEEKRLVESMTKLLHC